MSAAEFNGEVLARLTTYLSQFDEFQPHGDDSADQAFRNIVECIERLRGAEPVATIDDYGVRYADAQKTGWLQDWQGFPMLYSKAMAERMCISPSYTVRKLRICAYDITEEQ